MPSELTFIVLLGVRMAVAAAFVVSASVVTERAGPVIGARKNGMRYDSAYSDLGVRDAEIKAHAEFRKHLYAYDVVPLAQRAAARA